MTDLTPMELSENVTDAVIAGLVSEASRSILPGQMSALMISLCTSLDPAEA